MSSVICNTLRRKHGSYVVIRKAVFHVFLRDTGHEKDVIDCTSYVLTTDRR